jgi:NADH-quinone oxidoreductase subunit L
MQTHAWLWWIALLPLLGSAVCGVLHFLTLRERKSNPDAVGPSRLAGGVAVAAIGAALILAVRGWLELRGLPVHERVLESPAWDWISVGELQVLVSLVLDPLSITLTLVITGVGFLIHAYSTGYMRGDPGYAKFFAYLNLFVFAMLMLVLSSNLLGLFIGWEGVGLCSYLLIGFWYEKGWPAEAGQKAFVMNRIGDACFLVGSFLLVRMFGTLDLSDVGAMVPGLLGGGGQRDLELALAALLLFGGCCGKSAQFPLFTWLPDAMAGPTPVSALIHAATMVTAGVYLVVRLNPLFAASPGVLALIAVVGALTALIGASTALVQRDIKKVLAYSTVSQLGYMFLGLGSGAFAAAIFHLVTHAFFKGLLFLGAGSVIHGMHDEQDMQRMGGLRKHMPRTYATFLAGAAALSGLPLMSGYFSKDEILAHTLGAGGVYVALWIVGLGAAALTAFYTWRMVALTFFGPERFDHHHVHPHESPPSMTLPLVVLAVLSVFGGLLGLAPVIGHIVHLPHVMSEWLAPVIEPGERVLALRHGPHGEVSHALEWILLGVGAAVALVFAHLGFRTFMHGPQGDQRLAERKPALASFLSEAWRIDSGYQSLVVLPARLLAFVTAVVVDQFVIDGLVNGSASLARAAGQRSRKLASGDLRAYALWIGAGAVALSFLWMWS